MSPLGTAPLGLPGGMTSKHCALALNIVAVEITNASIGVLKNFKAYENLVALFILFQLIL
jgi:hypothetical protein